MCANSIVNAASLLLLDLSRKVRTKALFNANDLNREAKNKISLSVNNEAITTSLKQRTLLCRAKLTFKGRAKIVTSPCKANSSSEAILASPTAKKTIFKARPRAFQHKKANCPPPRVSVLDRLSPTNTDLQEFLNHKRKLCSKESVHVSPS